LRRRCDPANADVESAAAALAETVSLARQCAERSGEDASTTFLATDGRLLLACRRRRTLFVSSPAPDEAGSCEYVAVASEDPGEPPPGGKRAWRLLPRRVGRRGCELHLRVRTAGREMSGPVKSVAAALTVDRILTVPPVPTLRNPGVHGWPALLYRGAC